MVATVLVALPAVCIAISFVPTLSDSSREGNSEILIRYKQKLQ